MGKRNDIVAPADLRAVIRGILFSPLIVTLCVSLLIFTSLLTPGGRLDAFPLAARIALNGGWTIAFVMALAYLLPPFLHAALTRNFPYAWSIVCFLIPVSFLDSIMNSALNDGALHWESALWYWFTTMAMVVLAVTLTTALLQREVAARLSRAPEAFPMWWPGPRDHCPLATRLAASRRGPIDLVLAEDHYIRIVTKSGESLLRMSLTEAEAELDGRVGSRVHRSVWVRHAHIAELHFEGGNPRLTCRDGRVLPASRKAVPEIRRIIEARA